MRASSIPQVPLPPEAEAAAWALEENLWALWSRFGRGAGCALHETPHALWYETPIPTLPYNGVLRFRAPDRNGVGGAIDGVVARFRARGVPFLWMLHPSAQPGDLASRLRARGLEESEPAEGMWIDLERLPAPEPAPRGLAIREMTSDAEQHAVLDLVRWRWGVREEDRAALEEIAAAFELGRPGSAVRCWIAWQDDEPVAKAFLHLAAGAAGLYAVATRPEARGLGLARNLALHAFAAARAAGHRLGILHSTPMARGLYRKLGFLPAANFRLFAPAGSFHL